MTALLLSLISPTIGGAITGAAEVAGGVGVAAGTGTLIVAGRAAAGVIGCAGAGVDI